TIDARRQRKRHLRACGFVDRALQRLGLVVRTAGPDAILRGIAPERGGEGSRARGIGRHRQRAGRAADGCPDEMAAIDVHGCVFLSDAPEALPRSVTLEYVGAWQGRGRERPI